MDCVKVQDAAEHIIKSRCQCLLPIWLCHGRHALNCCYFEFSHLSGFFFPRLSSSSSVHPMWQGPLAVPGGDRQSPIDIVVRKSIFDSELKPLVSDYDPDTCQQIWNNGYSFLVEYDDTTDKSSEYLCLIYVQPWGKKVLVYVVFIFPPREISAGGDHVLIYTRGLSAYYSLREFLVCGKIQWGSAA